MRWIFAVVVLLLMFILDIVFCASLIGIFALLFDGEPHTLRWARHVWK